jgi:hypothetical protein
MKELRKSTTTREWMMKIVRIVRVVTKPAPPLKIPLSSIRPDFTAIVGSWKQL